MSKELRDRSIHELRGIAQSFGIHDIFEKDASHLIQAIELKQKDLQPKAVTLPSQPPYDARLMTKPPAKRATSTEVVDLLAEHVKLGLKLRFDEERWYMASGIKNDEGTLRMPLRNILDCAESVMK